MPYILHRRPNGAFTIDPETPEELTETPEAPEESDVSETSEESAVSEESAETPEEPEGPVEAPRGNASRDEWAAYAATQGHTVTDDMTRKDIKNLLED